VSRMRAAARARRTSSGEGTDKVKNGGRETKRRRLTQGSP
jgi:hypothetical protein